MYNSFSFRIYRKYRFEAKALLAPFSTAELSVKDLTIRIFKCRPQATTTVTMRKLVFNASLLAWDMPKQS